MTQEEKELLLKDLCARLPYDVKVRRYVYTTPTDAIESVELFDPEWLKELYSEEAEFKPYLFPLSSMSEEERIAIGNEFAYGQPHKAMDILHKRHIDYRGLIPKGLAIDATGKTVY